ncbi:CDP-glycerol glycerophosphotransferase family protein [Flavobacterium sp. Fl-77]|uniref:CDP-glycerol glycerophosphotransferase family protein n=1 Tax=Flavobacterium flavipigmentatum TaxID=2893884 RepID=A0AAJ2VX51_9FLAO|nr:MULTISPECIES: CDP-glycerol glycerophosphotransferase family protein [unclassified Flavobacterium]MDX6182239.1 CDP-glycerol glycerophosphotransferase family protein [Flavobacterium sp. Fl-33]MDX6185848.1 CDP-glycerol glycerophosphotransferase family protein [Flavobacterium sp. Fl-77]UFH39027.1 CDP-glycerol glycerophosphotransferase family protein [Flavobacterium sp. F-70]
MKKLGIVITDGVGFRNFVMSNFIIEASQQFDKIVIYSGLPASCYRDVENCKIEIKELTVFNEGKVTWAFRKWKELAHLQKYKIFYGMNDNLVSGYPKNNSIRSIFIKIIYFFTKYINSDSSILFAEKMQFLSFSKNNVTKEYLELLKKDTPSHLFFTHQRPPYLAPFLYAAIQLKIPAGTFIFSWDNLASKGRMLGNFDYFLVWSQLMKEELFYFYPNVKNENVKIVGTPQFEPYVLSKYESTSESFFAKFGLDNAKKIICYSCADASIGQNDPLVIKAIAEGIRNNEIKHQVQLLVRTSPAEDDSRFRSIRDEFPGIIWNVPKWILTRENHSENWSQRIPSQEDISDLRSILENSDLSINMCSTMSLDFMLFDKPVINAVFGNLENGLYNDQRFLNYDHYKKVVDSNAVMIAKNTKVLIDQINTTLNNPSERMKYRKAMIDLQVGKELVGTSKRIIKVLSEL